MVPVTNKFSFLEISKNKKLKLDLLKDSINKAMGEFKRVEKHESRQLLKRIKYMEQDFHSKLKELEIKYLSDKKQLEKQLK